MKRNEFLQIVFRTGILAVMAIITGIFLVKNKIAGPGECDQDFQCKSCNRIRSCNLPETKKEVNNG